MIFTIEIFWMHLLKFDKSLPNGKINEKNSKAIHK